MRVDHELDRLALACAGARVQAGDHVRVPAAACSSTLLERLLADVDRELLHVVGERGRCVDREVHDDVGPERLDELDDAEMRRSAGASDTSDASSMSSGRMPSTSVRPA